LTNKFLHIALVLEEAKDENEEQSIVEEDWDELYNEEDF